MFLTSKLAGSAILKLSEFSERIKRVADPAFLRQAEPMADRAGEDYLGYVKKYFPRSDSPTGSGHASSEDAALRLSKNWVSDVDVKQTSIRVAIRNLLGSRQPQQKILTGLDVGFSAFNYETPKAVSFLGKAGKTQWFPARFIFRHKVVPGFLYSSHARNDWEREGMPRLRQSVSRLMLAELTRRRKAGTL